MPIDDPLPETVVVSMHLNGTIEGAMKAGNEAYPPDDNPPPKELFDFIKHLFS